MPPRYGAQGEADRSDAWEILGKKNMTRSQPLTTHQYT